LDFDLIGDNVIEISRTSKSSADECRIECDKAGNCEVKKILGTVNNLFPNYWTKQYYTIKSLNDPNGYISTLKLGSQL